VGPYAGYLDGSTDWVNVPNRSSLQPTGAFSVSAWVKVSNPTTTYFAIVTNFSGCTGGSCGWDLGSYVNHKATFVVRAASTNSGDVWSPGVIDDGAWHYVVGVFTGSQVVTYSDGVAGTPVSWSTPIIQSTGTTFQIAGRGGPQLGGLVDDVRLYNRALSAAEIATMYAGGK